MVEILDEQTKKEIKAVIDGEIKELKKSWKSEASEMKKSLDKEMKSRKKVVGKKLEDELDSKAAECIESFKENPMEWVAGAFVAGLLLGGLFRK